MKEIKMEMELWAIQEQADIMYEFISNKGLREEFEDFRTKKMNENEQEDCQIEIFNNYDLFAVQKSTGDKAVNLLGEANSNKTPLFIKSIVAKALHVDYIPIFNEKEEVIYENCKLYAKYQGQEACLDIEHIASIKIDKLYKEREAVKFTMEEAKAALHDMDNPKYRMLFVKEEDLVFITLDEFFKILDDYKAVSFSSDAYKEYYNYTKMVNKKSLYLAYKPVLHYNEEVLYRDGILYVKYQTTEKMVDIQDIVLMERGGHDEEYSYEKFVKELSEYGNFSFDFCCFEVYD